jgi:indole-3-glycerol phosphate synthase
MANYLDKIIEKTRAAVAEAKLLRPVAELDRLAALHEPRGWAAVLRQKSGRAVIAEIKKASPSKGLIRADFEPVEIAQSYERGGAAALSVLTDEPFFQGSLEYLRAVSAAVALPCLRKDFMVDKYQFVEARANCADAVLLIAAVLSNEEMKEFAAEAHGLKLDVLVEVHTADELKRVLDALGESGADAIGVNNRDLTSFEVSLERSIELVGMIPQSVVRVSESGIECGADVARLRAAGFDAFLIGESFMRKAEPGVALAELLRAAEG